MYSSSEPCHWMTFHWKCALQFMRVGVQARIRTRDIVQSQAPTPTSCICCCAAARCCPCNAGAPMDASAEQGGDRTANDSRGIQKGYTPNLLPKCLYKRRRMSVVKLGSSVTVTRSEVKIGTNFEISLSVHLLPFSCAATPLLFCNTLPPSFSLALHLLKLARAAWPFPHVPKNN